MLNHRRSPSPKGHTLRNTERPQTLAAMMKCVLLALSCTLLLGALLLCMCTALLLLADNPIHYAPVLGVICLYLTSALGGLLATRLYGRRAPVLCGLTLGILLMLCLGLPALFFTQSTTNAATALLLRLLIPLFSLTGAILATRKRKTRPRRAHKRQRT